MAGTGRTEAGAALVRSVAGCDRCPLASSGRPSLSRPPARATLLILGEAPGRSEAVAGEPFVGPSGRLLSRALADLGLLREEAIVTNVVLHRPTDRLGKDRHPRPAEIRACAPWLDAQLAIVRPKVVLALGQVATARLLGASTKLDDVRGRAQRCGDRWVVPTYHPASLNRAAERRARFDEDLRLVADLARAVAAGAAATGARAQLPPSPR